MSIYGTIFTTDAIDRGILAVLEAWLPTYLAETERQTGYAVRTYERPKDYVAAKDFAKWPENQLPCVMVVGGDISDTEITPDGYAGWYDFEVGAVVSASAVGDDNSEQAARRMASAYAAAIRLILMQKLGSVASSIQYVGESTQDPFGEDNRSLAMRSGEFRAFVHGLGDPGAGPVTQDPPDDPDEPHPDWPVVSDVSVTFNAQPIG